MANISISEIQTVAESLNNNDLLLVSKQNNGSYQSAKINGTCFKESFYYKQQFSDQTPLRFTHWSKITCLNRNIVEYYGMFTGPIVVPENEEYVDVILPEDIPLINPHTNIASGGVFFNVHAEGGNNPECLYSWEDIGGNTVIRKIRVKESNGIAFYMSAIALYSPVEPLVNRIFS